MCTTWTEIAAALEPPTEGSVSVLAMPAPRSSPPSWMRAARNVGGRRKASARAASRSSRHSAGRSNSRPYKPTHHNLAQSRSPALRAFSLRARVVPEPRNPTVASAGPSSPPLPGPAPPGTRAAPPEHSRRCARTRRVYGLELIRREPRRVLDDAMRGFADGRRGEERHSLRDEFSACEMQIFDVMFDQGVQPPVSIDLPQ